MIQFESVFLLFDILYTKGSRAAEEMDFVESGSQLLGYSATAIHILL